MPSEHATDEHTQPEHPEAAVTTLLDAFGRIRELVHSSTNGLSLRAATYRPDSDANTIDWLIWHLTRVQDSHLSQLTASEQVWTANGWYDAFELPFTKGATGYGQSSEEVETVAVEPAQLAAYHADVDAMTTTFLRQLDPAALSTVVDERWDPPVTMSARLVSVIGDCLQHLGQVSYLRGLAERE